MITALNGETRTGGKVRKGYILSCRRETSRLPHQSAIHGEIAAADCQSGMS